MTELTCRHGVDLLMDYLEGVLPPELRERIAAHVAGCEKCAAFVQSYQATPRIIRDATDIAPPAALGESLIAFLRQHR